MALNGELLLIWIQIIVTGIVFLIMLRQRIVFKVKPLNWMALIFFLAFIRAVVDLFVNYIYPLPEPLNELHFIIFSFILVIFYFFAEFVNADFPRLWRFVVVFTLFGGFITLFFLTEIIGSSQLIFLSTSSQIFLFEPIFDLLQLVVWSFSLYIFVKMLLNNPDETIRTPAILLNLAILGFVISAIIELNESFTQVEIPSAYTTLPSFLILMIIYIIRPDFAYSTPSKLYRLMVIHEDGPTLINLTVDKKYRSKERTASSQLVGGITTSFNQILKEITNSDDNIEEISLSQTSFLFNKNGKIFTIIETERPTRILRDALADFSEDFVESYHEEIEAYTGDLNPFLDFDKLVRRYFPFIVDPKLLENVS